MKAFLHTLSFLILFTVFFAPGLGRAQDDPNNDQGVSFQTFYDQLGDQGTWVQTDDYGYVFQPNVQDQDWAPYRDGHWVDSDDGWTWVSDEPWGWATYHYGRWANIDGMGWVWVPGYRWAPAWVSWRYGGGYAGWAPLPPETFEGSEYGDAGADFSVGFHFGSDVDVSFDIGPGCYNFVPVEYLGERDYRHHYEHRDRNFVIINNTRNVTNININGNRAGGRNAGFRGVSVGGPSIADVNAHSRQHVQRVNLTAANQAGRSTLQGNSLAVFAPRVNPASAQQARPNRVGQTINQPKFNRGNSITNPLAVSANVKPLAPNAAAIQAAQKAQASAPATAKIATDKTPQRTHMNKPLTSMTPLGEAPRTAAPQNGAQPAASLNSNVNPPSATGEQPDRNKHDGQNNAAAAPFTGETAKPAATQQPNAVNPKPEATFNSNVNPPSATGEQPDRKKHDGQNNAVAAPFTGETAKPAATPQPSVVNPKPEATINSNVNPPSATGEQPDRKKHERQVSGEANNSQVESHQQQQQQAEAQQAQQQQAQNQARQQQAQAEREVRQQQQQQHQQQAEAPQAQQPQIQHEARQPQAQAEHVTPQQPQHQAQQAPPHQEAPQRQEKHESAPAPAAAAPQPQTQPQQAPQPNQGGGGNGGGGGKKDRNGQ